jgi:uncharacterized protein (DUF885 family)
VFYTRFKADSRPLLNSEEGLIPLRRFPFFALPVVAFLLLAIAPAIHAQKLSVAPAPPATVEENRKALNSLFAEYWQANMEHNPEFASSLGDKRYNDQTSDYSVQAVNDGLAREQKFLMRLAAIDPTGLTDQEKISQDLLIREFEMDQEGCGVQGVGDAHEPDGRHLQ